VNIGRFPSPLIWYGNAVFEWMKRLWINPAKQKSRQKRPYFSKIFKSKDGLLRDILLPLPVEF